MIYESRRGNRKRNSPELPLKNYISQCFLNDKTDRTNAYKFKSGLDYFQDGLGSPVMSASH